MLIRRAPKPGFPASPSRQIYGRTGGQTLVLPLDLTMTDFIGNNEVVNIRGIGALNGFAISGVGAVIDPGYSHPSQPAPDGFITATSTINIGGIPLAHAPVPGNLFNNMGLSIEFVDFTANAGWQVVSTSYSATLLGTNYTPSNFLGVMSIEVYHVALSQTLQPQITGARIVVKATGELLGMLVVERPNSNFAFVVPASLCP